MLTCSPLNVSLMESWISPVLKFAQDPGPQQLPETSELAADLQLLRPLSFGLELAEQRDACLEATELLFTSLTALRDGTGTNVHLQARLVLGWAACLEPAMQTLIASQKPVALVILARYAVLMAYSRSLWWLDGWAAILMNYVEVQLGHEWTEFLRWPKNTINRLASEGSGPCQNG
jgi:hypothetical protein